jgi:acetolactate decarboxylase
MQANQTCVNKMQTNAKFTLAIALTLIIALSAFYVIRQTQLPATPGDKDVLYQLAAFNTFSLGNYGGFMSYADLAMQGDFGIGTFDGLDGEMIALDGVFYQIPSDGVPKQAAVTQTTPYATVTFFEADQTFSVSNLNYTEFRAFLDEKLDSKGGIYAIKASGTFDWAQTRSPQKQSEPYPNITEALKTQSIFSLGNVSATAVGFWFPKSMDGVDYAGYHLHLLTDDHTAGGHLLDCIIDNVTVEVDQIKEYNLVLP